jgi:hypothetical protein
LSDSTIPNVIRAVQNTILLNMVPLPLRMALSYETTQGGASIDPVQGMMSGGVHQFRCVGPNLTDISTAPSHVDLDVVGVGPPGFLKPLRKRSKSGLSFLIVGYAHQHTVRRSARSPDCAHAVSGHAAEQLDELAASYSITSSARC